MWPTTPRYLSYYDNDLVVIDWDAALLVDEPADFDEVLYIMELANLQLAELEAYDRPLRSRGDILRELREIRIDMARFNDELSNITKIFLVTGTSPVSTKKSPRASISRTGTAPSTASSRRWTTST